MSGKALLLIFCTLFYSASSNIRDARRHEENKCSVVKAGYRFSFALYKDLVAKKVDGNLIFSPYSISVATSMLMLGTRGDTEKELSNFLQFGPCTSDNTIIHAAQKTVREYVEAPSADMTLTTANKMFLDQSLALFENYTQKSEIYYGAASEQVDFVKDPEGSRKIINDWISTKTNGLIEQLFPSGSISSLTQAVLANAIYFKGTWRTQFDPKRTRKQSFFVDENTVIPTDFMTNKAVYKQAANRLFSLLELPYDGDSASMIIILPKERFGLTYVENVLSGDFLRALNHYGYPREINVRIPKFKLEYDADLISSYNSLGVKSLFDATADFSGMSDTKGMFISRIRHKAFIEVNEEGTEAAAATGFAGSRSLRRRSPIFSCDHPFLYYIVHKTTKTILFLGRYVMPVE